MSSQNAADNAAQQKRDFKLLVDNQIKKGHEKLIRYGGEVYSSENHGQGVVIIRDPRPRMNRLWARREILDLKVPRYKVDAWFVGEIPPKEVTFSKLNDNINRQFMEQMCKKFGKLERVKVYHHPKTQKHMGLSKVIFTSQKAAKDCVESLHMTSVMGNVVHAEIDPRGELLNKMYQKICRGEMLAETMPDVIRHTQEKVNRHHSSKRDRRKSSQEDPRKLKAKNSSGPKTPPMPTEKPKNVNHEQLAKSKSLPQSNNQHPDLVEETNKNIITEEEDLNLQDTIKPAVVSQHQEVEHTQSLDERIINLAGDREDKELQNYTNSDNDESAPTVDDTVETKRHENKHKKKKERKKKKEKHKQRSRDSPSLSPPDRRNKRRSRKHSTTDLEARINSLLNDQNDNYEHQSNSSRSTRSRHGSASDSVNERSRVPSQIDLEDGECSSGEEKKGKSPAYSPSQRLALDSNEAHTTTDIGSVHEYSSPNYTTSQEFIEKKERVRLSPKRFSRSREPSDVRKPSPGFERYRSPERRSPPRGSGHFHPDERRLSPYSMERMRRSSPGRRGYSPPRNGPQSRYPAEHVDRHYHERRRHNPSFDHHRRSPGFENRNYVDRRRGSPEFSHRGRGSPPRYNFNGPRHFNRSPGRRSVSPEHRRMARRSPERYPPGHYNHHPRMGSPEYYRRRRSPGPRSGPRDRCSPSKRDRDHRRRSNSPSLDDRRTRHRELPVEFRDRFQYERRSPSKTRSSRASSPRPYPERQHSRGRNSPYSPHRGNLPAVDDLIKQERINAEESANMSSRIHVKPEPKEEPELDDKPMSLDQRLRELTGEPIEQAPEPVKTAHIKTEHPSPADESAVDMEISEGESDSDKKFKAEPIPQQPNSAFYGSGMNNPPQNHMWDAHRPPHWNNYDPRPVVPAPWGHRPEEIHRFPQPPHPNFMPGPPLGAPHHFAPNHAMYAQYANRPRFPHERPMNGPWPQDNIPIQGQFRHQFPEWNPITNTWQTNQQPPEEIRVKEEHKVLTDRVLDTVIFELKGIINRDLNKKAIESMAFKVYENWWDDNEKISKVKNKPLKQNNLIQNVGKTDVKQETNTNITDTNTKPAAANKLAPSANTFDPLNWAKNSFSMDGFGIGLGLRSALSTMPSFRIKKKPPSPSRISTNEYNKNRNDKRHEEDRDYRSSNNRFKSQQQNNRARQRKRLDSEGEDEEESEESSEEDEDFDQTIKKRRNAAKSQVLRADEIFSSSESESESEEEESSEEESEIDDEETEKEEHPVEETPSKSKENLKRKIGLITEDVVSSEVDDVSEHPPIKRAKESDEKYPEKIKSTEIEKPTLMIKPVTALGPAAASLLSPTATNVSGALTQQHLKHVHPKKRHRLMSQEDTRNLSLIADVSEKLRSDDELSSMSDKEKCALEALTDMKMTPDRRLSSQSQRFSESSDSLDQPPLPQTPGRQISETSVFSPTTPVPKLSIDKSVTPEAHPTTPEINNKDGQELEAVHALLSIKQSNQIPPISPSTPSPKKNKRKATSAQSRPAKKRIVDEKKASVPIVVRPMPHTPSVRLSPEQKSTILNIAAEHSYFKLQEQPPLLDLRNLTLSLLYAEHNYSLPYTLDPQYIQQRTLQMSPASTLSADPDTLVDVEEENAPASLEIMTAAERVKLRRISKESEVKVKPKKQKAVIKDIPYDFAKEEHLPPPRSYEDEMEVLFNMWKNGLDLEDMKYLREVYENCLAENNPPKWVNDTLWAPHPVTALSNVKTPRKKNKNKDEMEGFHKTGCARSEGFYKLEDKAKLMQRRVMYRQVDYQHDANNANKSTNPNLHTSGRGSTKETAGGSETSREARHLMRRIASEFGSDAGDLFKYNQLMFRKKAVKFKRSSIHGWGLFAEETIGADEMVIEYVGQVVRTFVAENREVEYTKRGIGSSYLFRIDTEHIIDATKCGNYARFMNHSCNPSCYAKVITVDSMKKIVIYSKQTIKKNDEITYDYKFPIEDDKIPCYCGASNCRGTLN